MTDDLAERAERLAAQLRRTGHLVTLAGAVSETVAAELIGVSPRTLRHWRHDGVGPRAYTAGRTWYPLLEIVRFLASGGRSRRQAETHGNP